ncbi:phage-related protein [Bacillus sp. JCM 19047]|nr:phage-related protein [Bacillus sp. JCM 19047]
MNKYIIMSVGMIATLTLGACTDTDESTEPVTSTAEESDDAVVESEAGNDEEEANNSDEEEEITLDTDDLFETYEEAKSESDYNLSQMQDLVYSGMDYETYIDETMFELMLSESYFNESDSVSFDVWIAQDGFLGVEVTPENGVSDIREFNTMVEADEYGSTNYGAL